MTVDPSGAALGVEEAAADAAALRRRARDLRQRAAADADPHGQKITLAEAEELEAIAGRIERRVA